VNTNPDRDTLRQHIAEALAAKFTSGAEHTQGMRVAFEGPDGWPATRMVTPIEAADAVLAVLPDRADQVDQVAEDHRLALSMALNLGTGAPWDAIHDRVKELRRLADEAPTTAKPETQAAADRDALRRRFGDVLRHWGLLDEQIDQKAAEEYAVTDLLALLPEQTSQDAVQRARLACRRLTSALIAVEPLLTKPYPDDPRWTPWTRFVGPALKELSDALRTGPAANDEPAAGVGQSGSAACRERVFTAV
jgi:hypothetical protein